MYSERWSARWASVPAMLESMRQSVSRGEEDTLGQRLRDCYLLVLDDLGVGGNSDWVLKTIYTLIDVRYSGFRPTIVTTNLSLNDIANRLDTRLASRLAGGLVVELDVPDRRLRKGELS